MLSKKRIQEIKSIWNKNEWPEEEDDNIGFDKETELEKVFTPEEKKYVDSLTGDEFLKLFL